MRTLTLAEVARRLGVSWPTAKKIAAQLPGAVQIAARTRYSEDAINAFIERGGAAKTALTNKGA